MVSGSAEKCTPTQCDSGYVSKVLNDIFPEELLLIVFRISSQIFFKIRSGVKISLNKLGNGIWIKHENDVLKVKLA